MHRLITLTVGAVFIVAVLSASANAQILLGPAGAGTPGGCASWFTGAYGTAATSVDFDDPAKGGCDFVLSNSVAGAENKADWRCPAFSLGPAAGGARPITFTFAYKLVDPVASGNNMLVQLRFFDATGTNFIAQRVIPVGARTGDSGMTRYRTVTTSGILAPLKARTADVWINANIFEPWVSGTGRFDQIFVTTIPRSLLFKIGLGAAALLGLAGLTALLMRLRRAG